MTDNNFSETIIELEDSTWTALSSSKGSNLLPFLSEDCVMLFPLGMKVSHRTDPNIETVMTSEAFVPWKTHKMSEVEVTPVGEQGAVISYRVDATRAGDDAPFMALISSTWRKGQDGDWKMCVHQQTPFQPLEEMFDD